MMQQINLLPHLCPDNQLNQSQGCCDPKPSFCPAQYRHSSVFCMLGDGLHHPDQAYQYSHRSHHVNRDAEWNQVPINHFFTQPCHQTKQ